VVEDGHTSGIAWLRNEAKLASGVAADRIAVGENLEDVAKTVEAMHEREIGFAHLVLMTRLAEDLPRGRFDEDAVLERARAEHVTRFRKTCEHARHAVMPDVFVEREDEQRAQRYLELSPQENGAVWLRGWFEPEGASRLRSALEPLARPADKDDERTRNERMADALLDVVTENQETELVVTCSMATLEGRYGAPAAETEWGALLSSKAVQRMSCTAAVRRLVLEGDSVVLDLGRKQRLLSPQARRAVEVRDKHCVWPGCDRPPRWCDSHHREEWSSGGETSVQLSALICRRHHRMRHEGGWKLVFNEREARWKAIPPPAPDLPFARLFPGAGPAERRTVTGPDGNQWARRWAG
jgi:hypothetical protein